MFFPVVYFAFSIWSVVQQQHGVKKVTRATRTLVPVCTIFNRTRLVVNGFRLLGGPFLAGGHDTGTLCTMTLGVVVLAVSIVCYAGYTL